MADATITNPFATAASAFSPTTTGQVTGQESTLASWAAPYVTNMLGRARAIAQTPYQAYRGPLTAGPSDIQKQYFTGIGNLGFPSTLGRSFTDTGIAQSYMNPYMQQVLQPQMQAMQRQADIDRQSLGAKAAQAGAFGGARAGLMGSQLNAELMRQQQQATGKAYADAYTQGLGQFNIEQAQAQKLADMMSAAGATQRDITQQGIAAYVKEFERQRDYPMDMLKFQQSMLQGMPIQSVNYGYQQPSGFSQIMTGLGGLWSLYEQAQKAAAANAPATTTAPITTTAPVQVSP